jgi:hypothetical protein
MSVASEILSTVLYNSTFIPACKKVGHTLVRMENASRRKSNIAAENPAYIFTTAYISPGVIKVGGTRHSPALLTKSVDHFPPGCTKKDFLSLTQISFEKAPPRVTLMPFSQTMPNTFPLLPVIWVLVVVAVAKVCCTLAM